MNLDDCKKRLINAPYFNDIPQAFGKIRQQSSDFDVTEKLSFELTGEGEHLYLFVEKQDTNSDWLAKHFQRTLGLRSQDVGYAGKKDRYSVSRQWFSLHIPGKGDDDPQLFEKLADNEGQSYSILQAVRHNKKLRTGAIESNRFKIIIKDVQGQVASETLESIKAFGFPNYYGYQRFGREYANLDAAEKLFNQQIRVRSRNKRGIYLSAARSAIFNLQLVERLNSNTWDKPVDGDCLMIDGSQSFFPCEQIDNDTLERFRAGELHSSGWLPGKQTSQAAGPAKELEESVISEFEPWLNGLNDARMDSARRAYRVIPKHFDLTQVDASTLLVDFELPAGCFATSLLRELINITDEQETKSTVDRNTGEQNVKHISE